MLQFTKMAEWSYIEAARILELYLKSDSNLRAKRDL